MQRITGFAGDFTRTHTDRKHPLGALAYDAENNRVLCYVKNNSGGGLTPGLGLMAPDGATAETFYNGILSTAAAAESPARMLGVGAPDVTLANQEYGWVVAWGFTPDLRSNGTTTANKGQKPTAAGQFTDVAATESFPIHAATTENPAGAGNPFTGFVNFV